MNSDNSTLTLDEVISRSLQWINKAQKTDSADLFANVMDIASGNTYRIFSDKTKEKYKLKKNYYVQLDKKDLETQLQDVAKKLEESQIEIEEVRAEANGGGSKIVTVPIITGSDTIANGFRNVEISMSASSLLTEGNITDFKVGWNDGSDLEVVPANGNRASVAHTYPEDKPDGATVDIKVYGIDNLGNSSIKSVHTFTYKDNHIATAPSVPDTKMLIGTTDVVFGGSTDADGEISRYEIGEIVSANGVTVTTSTRNSNTIRFEVAGDTKIGGSFTYTVYAIGDMGAKGEVTTVNVTIKAVIFNDCGTQGFSVGICPNIPSDMAEMEGTNDKSSPNYGNYIHPLTGSIMVWIPKSYYKIYDDGTTKNRIDYKGAPVTGYVLERAFMDGGIEQDGVFVDKFTNSNSNGVDGVDGILVSLQNQRPVSTKSGTDYNGIDKITGVSGSTNGAVFEACKSRGADYAVTSSFIYSMLARMALAHSQASVDATYCAYKDRKPYLPKGNNNDDLGDRTDSSVTYKSAGYAKLALTGSASNLAKTSHNGQECGVIDLSGNCYEIASGVSNLNKCIADSVLVLQPTQRLKDLTAANLETIEGYDILYIKDLKTKSYYLGNSTKQVFSSHTSGDGYKKTAIGLALPTGKSKDGTVEFGNDLNYIREKANVLPIVGGRWNEFDGIDGGIFRTAIGSARDDSAGTLGVRLCRYVA